jgi:hypothetical protein
MVRFSALVIATVAVCYEMSASATSYPPVTFNELVTRADVIFVGDVTDVRPMSVTSRAGTLIKTRVTFRVWDPLWGTTRAVETFDFLGGELGGVDLVVSEMPTFTVGDRRVVFARRERSINPIVGFTQGILRITPDDAGVDRVWTLEGEPLLRPENIGVARPPVSTAPTAPMRLSDFRDRISRALEARRQ